MVKIGKGNGVMGSAREVIEYMQSVGDEREAQHLSRFFKTAQGEYGYGDRFLGIRTPATRGIVARCSALPPGEVATLLSSEWHEIRLCGLLVLVAQFERLSRKALVNDSEAISRRDAIVEFYLSHARSANNWDLVDLSVYKILGEWLMLPSGYSSEEKQLTIDRLADSDCLWEQRMSVVCTMAPLKSDVADYTLRYAKWHLHHSHDLMHKAVGWMLREMGKRVSMDLLRGFLREYADVMPRTALRYAIEHMSADERAFWMRR